MCNEFCGGLELSRCSQQIQADRVAAAEAIRRQRLPSGGVSSRYEATLFVDPARSAPVGDRSVPGRWARRGRRLVFASALFGTTLTAQTLVPVAAIPDDGNRGESSGSSSGSGSNDSGSDSGNDSGGSSSGGGDMGGGFDDANRAAQSAGADSGSSSGLSGSSSGVGTAGGGTDDANDFGQSAGGGGSGTDTGGGGGGSSLDAFGGAGPDVGGGTDDARDFGQSAGVGGSETGAEGDGSSLDAFGGPGPDVGGAPEPESDDAAGSGVDTQVAGRVVTGSRLSSGNTTVENGTVHQAERGQNADGTQTDTRGSGTINRGSTNIGPVKASVENVNLDVESEQRDAEGNVIGTSQGARDEVKGEATVSREIGTNRGVSGEVYVGGNVINETEQTEFERTNPEDGTSGQGTSESSETQINALGGARASAGGRSVAVQAEAGVRISTNSEEGVRDNGDGTYTEFEETEDSVGIGGTVRAEMTGPTTDAPRGHTNGSSRVEGSADVTLSTDREREERTFDENGGMTERNTESSSDNLFSSESEQTNEQFDDDGNLESRSVTRTQDTIFSSPETETEFTTFDNLTTEDTDNDSQVDNSGVAADSQESENSDVSYTAPDPDYTDEELDEIGNGDYGGDQSTGWSQDDGAQSTGNSGSDNSGAGGGSAGGASGGGSSSDSSDQAGGVNDGRSDDGSDDGSGETVPDTEVGPSGPTSDTDRSTFGSDDSDIDTEPIGDGSDLGVSWSVEDDEEDGATTEPSRNVSRSSNENADQDDARSIETGHPECRTAGSDPDGDGWGWENDATCIVVDVTSSAVDDGGDGGGGGSWQDTNPPEPVAVWDDSFENSADDQGRPWCESDWSDPDGDGWGWENEATCVVR